MDEWEDIVNRVARNVHGETTIMCDKWDNDNYV